MPEDMFAQFRDPKFAKATRLATSLFKTIKDNAEPIADVLDAFLSAGSASNVFKNVVDNFAGYLSNTFWGQVLTGIDFTTINTLMTEVLGPIFAQIGSYLGTAFASAPVGTAIGGLIGSITGMFLPGGQVWMLIGAGVGTGIEWLINYFKELWGGSDNWWDFLHDLFIPPGYGEPAEGPVGGGINLPGGGGDYIYDLLGSLLGSFQFGTDYVPRTGVYRLHEGERVDSGAWDDDRIYLELRKLNQNMAAIRQNEEWNF